MLAPMRALAPTLAVLLAACGSTETPDDLCGIAPTVTVEAMPADPAAREITVAIVFDGPVTGVSAGATVVAENARLTLSGEGATFTATLSELQLGVPFALRVVPQNGGSIIAALGCPEDRLAAETRLDRPGPVEAWRHVGPIEENPLPNRVALPYFVERTSTVGLDALALDAGRASLVDFDGDGREDLVTLPVTNTPLRPRFIRNVSAGGEVRFEDATAASGMETAEMILLAFGDLDNDGDADAFAGLGWRAAEGQGGVWENDGTGRFTHRGLAGTDGPALGQGFFTEAAAATLADLDGDGLLDLYVGHWYGGSSAGNVVPSSDVLYRGLGNLDFEKVELPNQTNPLTLESDPRLTGVGRAAYGVAAGDYDGDGDIDLFVNNYGAGRPAAGSPPRYWDHNILWRNDGNLSFVDTSTQAGVAATSRGIGGVEQEGPLLFQGRRWPAPIGGNGFGCQFADFDNDGDLDLVIGTIAHPDYSQSDRTMLHVNQGPPDYRFTEESAARGLEYYEDELHPVWVDVDNDGRLDLAMSRLRGGSKWRLYLQTEDQRFSLLPVADTGVDISRPGPTLWLDADEDGDLDFFMAQSGGRWFENRVGEGRNFLRLSLVGTAPADATGAEVRVSSSTGIQLRHLSSGEGHYNTQQSRVLHFGLGGDSGATVRIRWPDGETLELGAVRANLHLRVSRSGSVEIVSPR